MACGHVCSGVTVADVEIACFWFFGSSEITEGGTTLKRLLHTYGRTYTGLSGVNLDLLGPDSGWLMTFLSTKLLSMLSL